MQNLQFISDYKENAEYRLSFNQLAQDVFGIDFEKWYQRGFWKDSYVCHSYLDGDKVVANVSVSIVDLLIEGEKKRGIQVGTVMTHPDYRNKGLIASLMDKIVAKYEEKCDFFFLFAHEGVKDFYPKFGFTRKEYNGFALDVQISEAKESNLRKLDLTKADDRQIFDRVVANRRPISTTFGVENEETILAWYCTNVLPNHIYYLPEADLILLFNQGKGKLHLYDVISSQQVELLPLLAQIATDSIEQVIFYFTPDFPDVEPYTTPEDPDDILFVNPSLPINSAFLYPMTSHA